MRGLFLPFREKSPQRTEGRKYMAENSSVGYLIVQVASAFGAVPIPNATVAVRTVTDGVTTIYSVMMTDEDGRTENLEIPAPDPSYSLIPGSKTVPYSAVNIEVTADGYYGYTALGVPIFAGQTSIQNVNLIPIPDSQNFTMIPDLNQTVNESEPPNL